MCKSMTEDLYTRKRLSNLTVLGIGHSQRTIPLGTAARKEHRMTEVIKIIYVTSDQIFFH